MAVATGQDRTRLSLPSFPALVTVPAQAMCIVLDASCPALNTGVVMLRPTASGVQPSMFGRSHDHQVVDAVIRLDAVDVVDMLIAVKRSSDVLFHDVTMLGHMTATRNVDRHISRRVDAATTLPPVRLFSLRARGHHAALLRTVLPTAFLDLRERPSEWLAADQTDKRLASRLPSVRAIARTVLRARLRGSITTASKRPSANGASQGDSLRGHRSLSLRCRAGGVRSTARLPRVQNPCPQANSTTARSLIWP